jgi:DnaJ like chaperone protein
MIGPGASATLSGVWGKVVGGVAGFALGGPLGAILGAFAGHAVDRMRAEMSGVAQGPPDTATRQVAFSLAVIVLGAKMAKSDGHVSPAEIAAFKDVFRVPPSEVSSVGKLFNEARRDATGFEPYAQQIADMFRAEPQVLEELLAGLFHIAAADGVVRPAELAYLRAVATIFRLDGNAFERVRAAVAGSESTDPYRVLGVERGATTQEIKTAYRKLIRERHPDALIAKGMPAEFMQVAHEEMAAINVAYDRIAAERGIR